MTLAAIPNTPLRRFAGANRLLLVAILLAFFSPAHGPLLAQEAKPVERVYKHQQADVEKALEELQAYETARLPVLAGFVNAKANTLKDYDNPHYQFLIDLLPQGAGHTLVRVKAQITAWYAGGAASPHSQYAQIPSNGRLEEELLDRLSVYLEKGNKQILPEPAPLPAASPLPVSSDSRASLNPASFPALRSTNPPTEPPKETVDATETVDAHPVEKSSNPATLASQIAAAQSTLQAVEEKERISQQQITELENVAKSRQHITDFAIAKKPQTPVFGEPNVLSKVVVRVDAEDEFEVTDARNGWVHVRLDGTAQGWMPISELELPGDSTVSDDLGVKNFSVANEVIQTFTGDWPVLKGKSALFVLAQPRAAISEDVLGKSQLEFASHSFLEGYRAAIHSQQPIAGVVVIFTGEKPGVAAATLPAIRQWQDGGVSDQVFFARCSFDPADSFRDAAASH